MFETIHVVNIKANLNQKNALHERTYYLQKLLFKTRVKN